MVKFAPMVLVPSHNSYFDFLLASLVCFAVDLPLPAIASGQGWKNFTLDHDVYLFEDTFLRFYFLLLFAIDE